MDSSRPVPVIDSETSTKLLYALIAIVALVAFYIYRNPTQVAQPAPQPAIRIPLPDLIDPLKPALPKSICPNCKGKCDGRCKGKPFRVICPHCRNTITVQEPCDQTGDLPATEPPEPSEPPAKKAEK